MMRMKLYLVATFLMTIFASSFVVAPAASAACGPVMGITPWYNGMTSGASCEFKPIMSGGKADFAKTVARIAANVVQAALAIAGYVAVFFIFKGGFNYIYSVGSAQGMANAKQTIMNAVIGLIIAILSASIVGLIAGTIK
jgi:hypothetical protein